MSTNSGLIGSIVCALMGVSKDHLPVLLEVVDSLNKDRPEHILFAKKLKSVLPVRSLVSLLKKVYASAKGGTIVHTPKAEEIEKFSFMSVPGFLQVGLSFGEQFGEKISYRGRDPINLDLYLELTEVFEGCYKNLGNAPIHKGRVYTFTDKEVLKYVLASALISARKGKSVLPEDEIGSIFRLVGEESGKDVIAVRELSVNLGDGVWNLHFSIARRS